MRGRRAVPRYRGVPWNLVIRRRSPGLCGDRVRRGADRPIEIRRISDDGTPYMQDRLLSGRGRRPMLLALVVGVVLVLVGITGSALVAVVSSHFSSATLTGVAARDAALVELFVNDALRASDLDADGPGAARSQELVAAARRALHAGRDRPHRDPRRRWRGPRGERPGGRGTAGRPDQRPCTAAIDDRRASAFVVEASPPSEAVGGLPGAPSVVQELFPIIDEGDRVLGVVAMWRDAGRACSRAWATRRAT